MTNIHTGYQLHDNPFHNFVHGINGTDLIILVMHTSYLLGNVIKTKQLFTPLRIFSIVFSALCHDVGHTGLNNAF